MQKRIKNYCAPLVFCMWLFSNCNALAEDSIVRLPASLNDKGMPTVNLPLGGKFETLIIDTGSDIALHLNDLTLQRLEAIAIPTGEQKTKDVTGKISRLQSFNIRSLFVQGTEFRDLQVVNLQAWGLNLLGRKDSSSKEAPEQMVIGRPFFAHKAVLFDYNSGIIEIMTPGQALGIANEKKLKSFKLRQSSEGLLLEIQSGHDHLRFIVDTASTASAVKRSSVSIKRDTSCSEAVSGANVNDCEAVAIPGFYLNKALTINAVVVDGDLGGLEADGILGANFILKGVTIIDFLTPQIFME